MTGLKMAAGFSAAYFGVVWFTAWDIPVGEWHPAVRGFVAAIWIALTVAIYDIGETCFGKSKKRNLPK